MRSIYIYTICFVATTRVEGQDPARNQLPDFRSQHENNIGIITTSQGDPVEIRDTNTLNSDLLRNEFVLDKLVHSVEENLPERLVHAKGIAAFGYFEVTNDVSKYTKAKVFNGIKKKTPVVARFSTGLQNRGGNDLERENRGLAVKFYTEEGNLDLVGLHIPVFLYKDPMDFIAVSHALRRNPVTNLIDSNARFNLIMLRPIVLSNLIWLFSDYGIPKGYRKMDSFPTQTFELYNKDGDLHYARFNFRTEQGIANYSSAEANIIKAIDPDFFNRDLFNAIARKDYPAWKLEIDVIPAENLSKLDYDPFDVTKLWRAGTFKTVPIGRLVINQNLKNFHADSEIAAYDPSHLVPGIRGGPDNVFASRTLAYKLAIRHRVGINFHNIEVNKPLYLKNYNRDGVPPVKDNGADSPSYYPNSFKGPLPFVDENKFSKKIKLLQSNAVDLEQQSYFYNHILKTEGEKQRLVQNIVLSLTSVSEDILEGVLNLLTLVDKDLGRRVTAGVTVARKVAIPAQALMTIDSKPPFENANVPTSVRHRNSSCSFY